VVPGGPAAETRRALEIVRGALQELGSDLVYIVRSRIYTTDIGAWQAIGAAHAEMLDGAFPACTMVEVRQLVDPAMTVEIEVEALVRG
jgi:isochorismate pyruvate lyase